MATTAEKTAKDTKITLDNLSAETVKDAALFKAAVTFDDKGVGTFKPGFAEEVLASLGVDKETYIKVQEADAHMHRAGALGFGQAGIEHMKKNGDLTHVSADLATFGKDKISFGIKRSAPYTIRDGEGTVTGTGTTYGSVSVDHKSFSTKKRGEMTKISSYLSDLAEAQLA